MQTPPVDENAQEIAGLAVGVAQPRVLVDEQLHVVVSYYATGAENCCSLGLVTSRLLIGGMHVSEYGPC